VSALNLIPDFELVVAQTGIFLANLVVVKSLIINPYLELQKKRQAQTSGSQDEAEKTLASCAQQTAELERRIKAAYAQASDAGEKIKAQALAEQQLMIKAAKQEAEVSLEAMRKEIAEQSKRETSKVPQIAGELSKEFYQTLTI
jgi:F0F1-type ATP synthase membrane subunit b/b'